MPISLQAQALTGGSRSLLVDRFPDKCPLCHNAVHPKQIFAVLCQFEMSGKERVEIVFQCPQASCESLFIGGYDYIQPLGNPAQCQLTARVVPITPKPADFSSEILNVSPTFVEIYNQALAAEAMSLSQLTGIGLRKALEFLVKDFASNQHSAEIEDIKKTPLGTCIDKYLADPNLKECAKLATWLGNDETHYIRKWLDKDINDLKTLIRLTVNWVENVLLTEKYKKDMNP